MFTFVPELRNLYIFNGKSTLLVRFFQRDKRFILFFSPKSDRNFYDSDKLSLKDKSGREIAVEIETLANHPEQIVRNYEKNARLGRFVIFVVPDNNVKNKVEECLRNVGKKKFSVYIFVNII